MDTPVTLSGREVFAKTTIMTKAAKMPRADFDPAQFFLILLVYLGVLVIAMILIEAVVMFFS